MKSGTTKPSKALSGALLVATLLIGCDRAETKGNVASGDHSQQTDQVPRGGQLPRSDSKETGNTQVADGASADKPDWRDALNKIEQVSSEREEPQRKLEDLNRLKKLGDEVISSGDRKLAWIELVSFLSKLTEPDSGNSRDKPAAEGALNVVAMYSETTRDASAWFEKLPKATRQQLLAGNAKKPTGTAWIIRMDFEDPEESDKDEVPASVLGFVARLQARIASADLPEKGGSLSHVFASCQPGEDGKKVPCVTLLWRPEI